VKKGTSKKKTLDGDGPRNSENCAQKKELSLLFGGGREATKKMGSSPGETPPLRGKRRQGEARVKFKAGVVTVEGNNGFNYAKV